MDTRIMKKRVEEQPGDRKEGGRKHDVVFTGPDLNDAFPSSLCEKR